MRSRKWRQLRRYKRHEIRFGPFAKNREWYGTLRFSSLPWQNPVWYCAPVCEYNGEFYKNGSASRLTDIVFNLTYEESNA
jgi:hypothetical protein